MTATIMALERLRSDPLAQLMRSIHAAPVSDWVLSSPTVTALAAEMLGPENDDPLAAQWLIRVFLALWGWPLKAPAAERALVERFLGSSYTRQRE